MRVRSQTGNSWRLSALLLASTAAVLLSADIGYAGPRKSEEVVAVSGKATKINAKGRQTISIDVTIEGGWHIYANPVGLKDLESVKTTLKVNQPKDNRHRQSQLPRRKTQDRHHCGKLSNLPGQSERSRPRSNGPRETQLLSK